MTREEAIKTLDAMWKMFTSSYDEIADSFVVAYTMAVDALKAQIDKDTNVHCNDAISRQAVLDLIEMSMNDLEYDDENEELQCAIRSLPSAKLNFDMTTKIDKAYDDGYRAGYLQAKHDWGDKDE